MNCSLYTSLWFCANLVLFIPTFALYFWTIHYKVSKSLCYYLIVPNINYFLYQSAPGCWTSSYFICLWYHFVAASSFEAQKVCSQADRYIRETNTSRPVGFRRVGYISLCYSATMVSQQYTWISNITQGCSLWKILAVVSQRRWWVGIVDCGCEGWEGSLEYVGTLKNWNSSSQ